MQNPESRDFCSGLNLRILPELKCMGKFCKDNLKGAKKTNKIKVKKTFIGKVTSLLSGLFFGW